MIKARRYTVAALVAILVILSGAVPALAQRPPAAPAAPKPPAPPTDGTLDKNVEAALETLSPLKLKGHTYFLSHDLMEGRGTAERGGDLAAEYIASQFMAIGLPPPVPTDANTTSYFQNVPLVGTTTDPNESLLVFTKDQQTITPTYLDQAIYWTDTQLPISEAASELVFAGYGTLAPEAKWDDFKDVDLTGKVLLMLVNDPPSEDPNIFGGKAMSYYGRWTYKFWVAAEKGAAGCLLIHTPDMAGYNWDVVRSSWGRERFSMILDPQGTPPLRLAGWLTEEMAKQIVALGGKDLQALMQAAAQRDFRPIPLGITAQSKVVGKVRNTMVRNVVGFLAGTDRAKQYEFVIYSAHYDHLGIGAEVDGDRIYNGAEDNATGVAALIEIARAFTNRGARPRRTLIFIATAGEEQSLRGSEFFTNRRTMFLLPGRMAADINLDGLTAAGETRDYVFLGADRSPQLRQYVEDAARIFSVVPRPDPHPEKGGYFRSDHFSFARIGVPGISLDNGLDFVDKPEGWGEQQYQEYLAKKYHRPDDEFDPTWDFKGLAKTAKIALYLGWRVGMDDAMPMWNPGDEFEEERKEALEELPPSQGSTP